ncbi:MAG: hypothetical protein HYR85_22325 [Planctomycetes bacterium]|nr:hypothetical protein [Planctomycetota bacterium]MBI3844581.1 hypothetical protein [Planctomycetota bacterium]
MNKQYFLASATLFFGAAMTMPALAQPVHAQPGSIMIYPLFDSSPGRGTLITVTNINESRLTCQQNGPNGFRQGDVRIHYTYINGEDWNEFDTDEDLTPGDTLTVFADQHNPEQEMGFLWVEARDPESGEAIDFDYLIGSAIIVDTGVDFLWSYTPYAFRGLPAGDPGPDVDGCGRELTDLDADQCADFDGAEYDYFPDVLYIDNFFGESATFSNELTLMSASFDPNSSVSVRLGIWNNNETRFSRSFTFQCWTRIALSDVTNVVLATNLRGADELPFNAGFIQTGWVSIDAEAPLLGVFMHKIVGQSFAAGHELHYTGIEGVSDGTGDVDFTGAVELCRGDL